MVTGSVCGHRRCTAGRRHRAAHGQPFGNAYANPDQHANHYPNPNYVL